MGRFGILSLHEPFIAIAVLEQMHLHKVCRRRQVQVPEDLFAHVAQFAEERLVLRHFDIGAEHELRHPLRLELVIGILGGRQRRRRQRRHVDVVVEVGSKLQPATAIQQPMIDSQIKRLILLHGTSWGSVRRQHNSESWQPGKNSFSSFNTCLFLRTFDLFTPKGLNSKAQGCVLATLGIARRIA